ncbi:MAG: hypothetical protein KGL63_01685 [Betaproteobacteria bacterium]|nr:hypothetical protein [Betaproteobacteria bacterium]
MSALTHDFEAKLGRAMLALARSEGHAQAPSLRPTADLSQHLPEWVVAFLRLACDPAGVQNVAEVRDRLRKGMGRETMRNWCQRLTDYGLLEHDGGAPIRTYRATEAGKRRVEQ